MYQADAKLDTAYLYIVIAVNQDLKSAIVAAANADFVETSDEYGCRRGCKQLRQKPAKEICIPLNPTPSLFDVGLAPESFVNVVVNAENQESYLQL